MRNFMQKALSRLRTKILLFGLFMSIAPFVILGLINMEISKEKLVEQVHSANRASIQNSVVQLESQISQTFQSLFVLRDSLAVNRTNDVDLYYLFHSFMKNVPYVESISRFTHTGEEQYSVNRWSIVEKGELNLEKDKNLLEQIRQGRTYLSSVIPNVDGKMIVTLAVPMNDMAGASGGILVQINLRQMFDQIFTHSRISKEATMFLLDEKGNLIGTPQTMELIGRSFHQYKQISVTSGIPVTVMDEDKNGDPIIGYALRVPSTRWIVVLEQSEKVAFASLQQIKWNLVLSTLLIVLLVSATSIVFALVFSGPIEKIASGVREISEGNFSFRIRVSTSDEIGRLAESVNGMAQKLQRKTNELLEEKQRLDMVVSGMGMGLILVDENFRVGWVNRTIKEWFQGDFIVGQHCKEALGGHCDCCENCPVHTEIMVKENQREMLSSRVDPQGKLRYFRHQIFRLYPEKVTSPFLEVIEDITEKREMESAVVQADKLAAIGMLASGIAHEINNPLGILSVYSEDLKERMSEEDFITLATSGDVEKYLDTIQKQIVRCKGITSGLLQFSRKSSITFELIHTHSSIDEILMLIQYEIRKKQIQIIKNYEAKEYYVNATASELQQVFLNVLTNALDAMEEHGVIQVNTYNPTEQELVIEMVDSGSGIRPDHLSKIFDPFFTTKPAGKGTGLGLSVCYGIIKRFGGDIQITSQVGTSTTVTIRLPCAKGETQYEL
ncbi:sensor histidine kinase [Brevibacillus ginsengisoli]|uniref:sensor histidine kinase n=1 Tax=Brevibacillus ginsengisoli TaxID=363854 RepID=UPI003CF67DCD